MKELREQLERHLPPIFAGNSLDELTGNAICWRTILNLKSKSKNLSSDQRIPADCFIRYKSRKVLVVRDRFLDWWFRHLS
jgi:hypothetical protein